MNKARVIVTKGKVYIEDNDIFITESDGVMLLLQNNTGLINVIEDDCSWDLSEYVGSSIDMNNKCNIGVRYVRSSTIYDVINPFSVKALWNSDTTSNFTHAGFFEIDSTSIDMIGEFNHNIIDTFDELNPYYYMEISLY